MGNRVIIVGGGLAGLAAAAALVGRGLEVTLLESRPRWGGRASSFVDQTTEEAIDNCQHVALGCCTNFLHFCQTVGIVRHFECERVLTFIGPDGRTSALSASPLPAPLHLFPSFAGMRFLSWSDKLRLALGVRALARTDPSACGEETFLHWLERHGQPPAVIERFWHLVLVSALSETLDRLDVGHARKVIVDGFLRNTQGWTVWVPTVPLDELYGTVVQNWLESHGVECRLQSGVRGIAPMPADSAAGTTPGAAGRFEIELRNSETLSADDVIIAVPQNLVKGLLPEEVAQIPELAGLDRLETAPISSVHLWFDRPLTELRHATIVGRLSQWLFNRSAIHRSNGADGNRSGEFYYQVVISASRDVVSRLQAEIIEKVVDELKEIWPDARDARLVHSRLVTEHKAVVSMLPGVDRFRPGQATSIPGMFLAGDWTQTGWPGTMEGAVRSGYLAAQQLLRSRGTPVELLQPDLPTARLSRWLLNL